MSKQEVVGDLRRLGQNGVEPTTAVATMRGGSDAFPIRAPRGSLDDKNDE